MSRQKTRRITTRQLDRTHNYLRPHQGLDGKTPSEACGIKIEGDNKWITLIQNAKIRKS